MRPNGVCATEIGVVINDKDEIEEVYFKGGCPGNATGLASLLKGLDKKTVISKLKGITCGSKKSSCPDQLASFLDRLT